MSIIAGLSDVSLLVFVVVIASLVWMIKVAYDLKKLIVKRGKLIDSKVSLLEGKAVLMRREVVDLHKNMHHKLDKEEFERRVDGLVELLGGKKSNKKHKDAR
ncbi:hypothetical protein KJ765_05430 [Candidatus Micrarchaeota archaeon]|nr:hypothetical protein [Candidatus Micrarchaeota archaeon]